MRKYAFRIFRIIIFLVLIVFLDQSIGFILRNLYFSQKTGPNHSLNYSFNECKADILVFGASQAQHNYDPRIISDSLKMSCYNAGQDGGHSILMQYAQIKSITNRYCPKIIILEFHPKYIVRYPGDYDRLSILLPYYDEYPELKPLILLRNPYEKIKLLSAIYPFNSNIVNIIRFNTETHAARKQDYNGFIPIKDQVMNINMLKSKPDKRKELIVDSNMVFSLKNIIQICKEKNIALYISSSPIFHTYNDKKCPISSVESLSLQMIRKENAMYKDYSYNTTFTGRMDLFKDAVHLNSDGATLFSEIIASWIKTTYKGNKQSKNK